MNEQIQSWLWEHQDTAYRDFQQKMVPTVPPETIIGVRTPLLRAYSKQIAADPAVGEFLEALPHAYFEENQLHAFLLCREKDMAHCLQEVRRFLPYVDNWATCDQMTPAVFRRHRKELLPVLPEWLDSPQVYTRRFAIKQLMDHFLEQDFEPRFLMLVAAVSEEDPYLQKMKAWYFATALAKQYEATLPLVREHGLSDEVHRMTIQKAVESYRISPEQKEELRSLRRKPEKKRAGTAPQMTVEWLDVVDETGEPTGQRVERREAHRKGIRHRTAHVWLLRKKDKDIEVLLQKRSSTKSAFPGRYDISSAGHIPAGDTYVPSALRELKEELGVTASPEQLVFCGDRTICTDKVFFGQEFHDRQYSRVFLLWEDRDEPAFALQEEEVEEVRWIGLEECIRRVEENSFPHCIEREELMLIKQTIGRDSYADP